MAAKTTPFVAVIPITSHKDKKYNSHDQDAELKRVREYLMTHNSTATMVATALNIYRPNLAVINEGLTRYKQMLQDAGALVVTHKDYCKETGRLVCYLSCDPDKVKGVLNDRG